MPKQLVLEKEKKGGKKIAGEEVLCAKGCSQRRQGELKKLKTICVVVAQRETRTSVPSEPGEVTWSLSLCNCVGQRERLWSCAAHRGKGGA